MLSIYQLKPRFQALLRPIAARLAAAGVTANQVTLAALVISIALGGWLFLNPQSTRGFLLLPLWMFLRMAFNAVDGMLARELGHATVIIVAQRVSTIMHADRIIVLDGGRIVGVGTHDALLDDCPAYREIVASQAVLEESR